ncbi:CBO0543 family protein [Alicyclobacillus hesperidum]|uniref:CBO0543 family protein n=1 Tax=Alicyclobacillus hesperidum TaxID=89784 RepID=UPI0024E174EB|nr:CBO0543 family protein [Alicyclobacillus hesperidum]
MGVEAIRVVILSFSAIFLVIVFATKTHPCLTQYCKSVLWVTVIALLYNLVCRGYPLWYHPRWWLMTDKFSQLVQIFVLLPCTTLLFLRNMPRRPMAKIIYGLCFLAVYGIYEALLCATHEIIYCHGWSFGWSLLLDACMFFVMWLHNENWRISVGLSGLIMSLFLAWFHVPWDT